MLAARRVPPGVAGPSGLTPMEGNPSGQLCFGSFRLDPVNACLWRGTRQVHLAPKAFAVLSYLARQHGQLVTKEALLETVWPGTTVGDAVLKVCVREIRRALGDRPAAPRFVDTIHRRGYRFIASVTPGDDPPPSGQTRPSPPRSESPVG